MTNHNNNGVFIVNIITQVSGPKVCGKGWHFLAQLKNGPPPISLIHEHIHTHIHIYIYIYAQREREIMKYNVYIEGVYTYIYICIHMYIYI